MTPQIMKPVLKPFSGVAAVSTTMPHDVGGQEPGRGADNGADGEQSAALSDRRDFAADRKPFQTPSS
jgi:hypothetical protein